MLISPISYDLLWKTLWNAFHVCFLVQSFDIQQSLQNDSDNSWKSINLEFTLVFDTRLPEDLSGQTVLLLHYMIHTSSKGALLWPLVADIGFGISPCYGDRPRPLLKHLLSCIRHSSHSIACIMLFDRPTVSLKNNTQSRLPGSFPFIVKHISVGSLVPLYSAVCIWSLFRSVRT
jgi:hypothetical protein